MSDRKFNIAIDGPAGAGKSTISRLVANALGYVYIDTGAMYRSVTWRALKLGIPLSEQDEIVTMASNTDIRLVPEPSGQHVYVDDEDVTEAIRSKEVTANVSEVSAIPGVRALLVDKQRQLAERKGIVMDGRDIGTNVLPDAELKVFMTAGVRVRAQRRLDELSQKNGTLTLEQLMRDIEERDRMDSEREVAPLTQAKDAILLDTSELTIEEVVKAILELFATKIGKER